MKSLYRWVGFVSLAVAAVIGGGMLLARLGGLDAPLIYDEIYSWITADPAHPFGRVWHEVLRADVNVPLFNLLLRAWAHVVPMTPAWMRGLPLLFSLVTPVCAWYVAPKAWNQPQKITFVSLLAASAMLVVHSSLLRTYSLAVLFVVVFTLLALRMVHTWSAGQAVPTRGWLAFGLVGVLACYSHYFAAALFFSTALFVLGCSFYYKKQRAWAVCVTAVVGLLWLLWAASALYSLVAGGEGGLGAGWWFKKPKLLASWEILEFLFGPTPVKLGILGFVIVGMTSFVFEERPLFIRRPEVWLALVQIILLTGAVGVISQRCNLLIGRYFLMVYPALYLLFTGLLMHLCERWKGYIVLLPLFVGCNMGYYLHIYQPYATDPSGLSDIFSYVAHRLHRPEVLVAYDRVTYPGVAAVWTLAYFLPKDTPLALTPLTRENAPRMQAPEFVPLVAPLSAFTYVMKFSDKYGFDAKSDMRQFKQTCLVRTLPAAPKEL